MLDILTKAGCYIAIIVLGMVLRAIGFFKEEDFSVLSKIVIRITLPAVIISGAAGRQINLSLLTLALLGMETVKKFKTAPDQVRLYAPWLAVLLGFVVFSYFNPYMNAALGILFYCCTIGVYCAEDNT